MNNTLKNNLLQKINKANFQIPFSVKKDLVNIYSKITRSYDSLQIIQASKASDVYARMNESKKYPQIEEIEKQIEELKKANTKKTETKEVIKELEAKRSTLLNKILRLEGGLEKFINSEKDEKMSLFIDQVEQGKLEFLEKLKGCFTALDPDLLTSEEAEGLIKYIIEEPANCFNKSVNSFFGSPLQ